MPRSLKSPKLLLGVMGVFIAFSIVLSRGFFDGDPAPGHRKEPATDRTYRRAKDGTLLIWVPGGEFTMGSDKGDTDEKPPHKVKVKGFWLGKFEIKNSQYAKFLKAKNRHKPMFWGNPKFNNPRKPVAGLTWEDAEAYCDWAGLRLPTESEWEYAASAGKGLRYSTATGKIDHDQCNFAGASGKDRWEDTPAPVGRFPENPWGFHDMAGNTWEWTSTLYKPYPYKRTDGREDSSKGGLRVMRGGSWQFPARYCSTGYRRRFASHLRYDSSGFRVALSEADPESRRKKK